MSSDKFKVSNNGFDCFNITEYSNDHPIFNSNEILSIPIKIGNSKKNTRLCYGL
jgi:hypothetical protein